MGGEDVGVFRWHLNYPFRNIKKIEFNPNGNSSLSHYHRLLLQQFADSFVGAVQVRCRVRVPSHWIGNGEFLFPNELLARFSVTKEGKK